MPLADFQITNLALAGMVEPFEPELVNPASLDVRLGDSILIESVVGDAMVPYPLSNHTATSPYLLSPGQFVLAHTAAWLAIPPSLSAQFALKSSRAREGLQHLLAGWIDPGFEGVLTLELKNVRQLQPVPIWPRMRIGQLVFYPMNARPRRSYAETGRYQGDTTVQQSRG
jgi:dCTP deaminase